MALQTRIPGPHLRCERVPSDADIRASSDRYLRNAIIAVLAHDRAATLWDAARLLSVGSDGYAYRRSVGARVRTLPEFKEISEFFTQELAAQLADARSSTTAKLDAPVNKLARLLNSPSIKRVLLNESLTVDFDQLIARQEVLVVKGALGAMGAGNTAVLMQLLVGMLDASLARQQDLRPSGERVAVALKIDEAPLVLNRGFAETMALKRSAGLETVACWQTDAQWVDREVREQLDALFAHRVYFATASARDARASVGLTMAEFSDTVRPGIEHLSALGRPDVRLHLPRHHAIASWVTATGRQSPFIARTLPIEVDLERLALHAERQHERGGRRLEDLRQPHWERRDNPGAAAPAESRSPIGAPAVAASAGPDPQTEARQPATFEASAGLDPSYRRDAPVTASTAPPDSYTELIALDGAATVRCVRSPVPTRGFEPDEIDLEILELIASMRHLLTSQVHRRFNPTKAATTTQRRLKRLSDAGLLRRFQFHRRDGGGVPMCCAITHEGWRLLDARGTAAGRSAPDASQPHSSMDARPGNAARLRQARVDVRAAAWALALADAAGARCLNIRGPEEAVISPPTLPVADGRRPLHLSDLQLPGGRTPHDFVRTDSGGEPCEVDRFETLRPRAAIEIGGDLPGSSGSSGAVDVLIELDDRLPAIRARNKLERYDHFLAGWSIATRRYGTRRDAVPLVVFVCRDRARARALTEVADPVLRACRAYAGEYPFDWEFPGRWQILFAAERDIHEGLRHAYRVPPLPPQVRVAAPHFDPSAPDSAAEVPDILAASFQV